MKSNGSPVTHTQPAHALLEELTPRRGEDEGALMHGCGSRAATSRAGTRSLQTACQRSSHPRLDSIFGRPIQQAEEPSRVRPASHRHRHRRVSRSVPPTSALAGRDGCTHVTRVPFVGPADAGVRSVRHPVRHLGDTPPSCPGNRGGVRVPHRPFLDRLCAEQHRFTTLQAAHQGRHPRSSYSSPCRLDQAAPMLRAAERTPRHPPGQSP